MREGGPKNVIQSFVNPRQVMSESNLCYTMRHYLKQPNDIKTIF